MERGKGGGAWGSEVLHLGSSGPAFSQQSATRESRSAKKLVMVAMIAQPKPPPRGLLELAAALSASTSFGWDEWH